MGIDRHVPCCTRQTLSLSVWDMLLGLRISVLLGHTKVNYMDDISRFRARSTDQKVVWLDISINQVFLMDRLYSRQHLLCHHHHGLDRKPSVTVIEEILKTWS